MRNIIIDIYLLLSGAAIMTVSKFFFYMGVRAFFYEVEIPDLILLWLGTGGLILGWIILGGRNEKKNI